MPIPLRPLAALALLAFAAAPAATPARAQFAADSDAPIDIGADTADYQPGVAVLSGQVDVRQADVRILADRMRIYSAGGGDDPTQGITRIEADGNFYYLTPNQEVRGTAGLYEAASETFTVTGDVILLQGDNVVTGERLIYDLTTEQARVVGTCQGRRCGREGRVRILIKQTPRDATPAPGAAS